MPPLRPWDHEIELKPGAPTTLRSKLIRLSQVEQAELSAFLKDHLK
jgi:hypothetical protein